MTPYLFFCTQSDFLLETFTNWQLIFPSQRTRARTRASTHALWFRKKQRLRCSLIHSHRTLICSLAGSLNPELVGKWLIRCPRIRLVRSATHTQASVAHARANAFTPHTRLFHKSRFCFRNNRWTSLRAMLSLSLSLAVCLFTSLDNDRPADAASRRVAKGWSGLGKLPCN